jgi:acetyl-CoA synthetase (ADP-forming)
MDFELLSRYGIKFPEYTIAKSRDEAAASAGRIGYPVALKIISPQALHKSDKGGVILNVQDGKGLETAHDELIKRFEGSQIDGVLVQKMAAGNAVELIIGGKKDSQFGQMIMLGTGGIFVEVMKDFTFRVCPITRQDAQEMIGELRSYPILAGARGRKPVSQKALAETLMHVSELLMKEDPSEFDLNPVMADYKGCVAVDVRIVK